MRIEGIGVYPSGRGGDRADEPRRDFELLDEGDGLDLEFAAERCAAVRAEVVGATQPELDRRDATLEFAVESDLDERINRRGVVLEDVDGAARLGLRVLVDA